MNRHAVVSEFSHVKPGLVHCRCQPARNRKKHRLGFLALGLLRTLFKVVEIVDPQKLVALLLPQEVPFLRQSSLPLALQSPPADRPIRARRCLRFPCAPSRFFARLPCAQSRLFVCNYRPQNMPSPRLAETILHSWQSFTTKRASALGDHQLHRFGIKSHIGFRWFQLAHQIQQSLSTIYAQW